MSEPKREPSHVVRREEYEISVTQPYNDEWEAVVENRAGIIVSVWDFDRKTAIRMADAAMKVKLGRKA